MMLRNIRCDMARILVGAAAMLFAGTAVAAPARIILLRHGEKADKWKLCPVGVERSEALRAQYLGKDAANSLFRPGETPKGFLAITLHSLELITPAAISWSQPVVTYAVDRADEALDEQLDAQTRLAARDLLDDPRWDGATVVVSWEHAHIAKAPKHRSSHKGEKHESGKHEGASPVTFFELLGLDRFADAPITWPGDTYDYFWIIDFDPATRTPTAFRMEKQTFTGPFANLPQNDWGQPSGLTDASKCELASPDDGGHGGKN